MQKSSAAMILLLVFVMLPVGKGDGFTCTPASVEITQSKTGFLVNQKPQWKVIVADRCPCVIYDASLVCPGFQTVEQIDPNLLDKQGDRCRLIRGEPLVEGVTFTYAWDNAYPFTIDPGFSWSC